MHTQTTANESSRIPAARMLLTAARSLTYHHVTYHDVEVTNGHSL
jgi:hypothetical protein